MAGQGIAGCFNVVLEAIRMPKTKIVGGKEMLDVIFVLVTIVFFALSILYVHGCDRLK